MTTNKQMLHYAIKSYGIDPTSLIIHKKLPENAHGDLHFKIEISGNYYSARLIGSDRYSHDAFEKLTDDVLLQQVKFCDFLHTKGIPFMTRIPPADGSEYIHFSWEGSQYRLFLFDWLEGRHITHCTEDIAFTMGQFVRQFHNISDSYHALLPKVSHLDGYREFIRMIHESMESIFISQEVQLILDDYLKTAEAYIRQSFTLSPDYVMQSDLNPLNILWDEKGNITGVVDIEHIGYTERLEGIAWLVKWYSRTHGINSDRVSLKAAKRLLEGYGYKDFLINKELVRLNALVWLTGCMNWGFTKKTLNILLEENGRTHSQLKEHLITYQRRGDKLLSLIPTSNFP